MDEDKSLCNGHLAYEFKDRVTEPRARGALSCVHHVLLECFVAPLHYLTERLRPEKPIDNLAFFQAVADTFATWDELLTLVDLAPTGNPQIINVAQAVQFANSLPTSRAAAILRHFIRTTTGMHLPSSATVDLAFCCRIVAAFVVREDVLKNVLSGAIARDLDQYRANPDNWLANAWSSRG